MGVLKKRLEVKTERKSQMVEVTGDIVKLIAREGFRRGRITVYVPHTTAAVTINERADPAVAADILAHLDGMVPWEGAWRHREGNSAAHIKASLMGSSVSFFVEEGRLELGTWQGVFLCEFDGPRRRNIQVVWEGH